jgi:hypothetical protein
MSKKPHCHCPKEKTPLPCIKPWDCVPNTGSSKHKYIVRFGLQQAGCKDKDKHCHCPCPDDDESNGSEQIV